MATDVVFRRINGRIVPIRKKIRNEKEKPSIVGGAALAAGGLAIAAAGGEGYRVMMVKANRSAFSAEMYAKQFQRYTKANSSRLKKRTGQLSFGDLGVAGFEAQRGKASKARLNLLKHAKRAKRYQIAAKGFTYAKAAGGLVVGAGLYKIGKDLERRGNDKAGEAVKYSAPAVGALVGTVSFGVTSKVIPKKQMLRGGFEALKKIFKARL